MHAPTTERPHAKPFGVPAGTFRCGILAASDETLTVAAIRRRAEKWRRRAISPPRNDVPILRRSPDGRSHARSCSVASLCEAARRGRSCEQGLEQPLSLAERDAAQV